MSLLRGTRKLLVAAGLAGCGAAAAVLLGGLNGEEGLKARAANVIQNHFGDHLYNGSAFPSPKWDYNWDRREPFALVKPISGSFRLVSENDENSYNEKIEKAKAIATRHLILVRHGQYNLNGENDLSRILTPLGRDQANHAGLRLKELGLPYTRIIQSTMTRARETAQIISQHLPNIPVASCDFIREGAPIQPEPPVHHYTPEKHKQVFEDGARIEAAFRKYFHRAAPTQAKDSYEIMVCHANVIRYFVCRALQFPPEAWLRFSLHNCSLTWIAIRPSGRVTVYTVGDIGHVPPNKMTTS